MDRLAPSSTLATYPAFQAACRGSGSCPSPMRRAAWYQPNRTCTRSHRLLVRATQGRGYPCHPGMSCCGSTTPARHNTCSACSCGQCSSWRRLVETQQGHQTCLATPAARRHGCHVAMLRVAVVTRAPSCVSDARGYTRRKTAQCERDELNTLPFNIFTIRFPLFAYTLSLSEATVDRLSADAQLKTLKRGL